MTTHAVATTDIIVRPESFLTTIPPFYFIRFAFKYCAQRPPEQLRLNPQVAFVRLIWTLCEQAGFTSGPLGKTDIAGLFPRYSASIQQPVADKPQTAAQRR
jgi:hypothetical protein